ncbi:hypothetical protein FACS1894199_04680 [Bacteroidia bacterium]|nr:hypothetical protein FACS1894199_04680 [Bacteroidia bacterium]
MQQIVDNIYSEIVHLSDTERDMLYKRMQQEYYINREIVAYSSSGEALTRDQYRQRINIGIEQCDKGQSTSLEDLCTELGYNYGDL